MRRWILICALIAVGALGYTLWPFLSLYQLGAALHARDAAGTLRHIDVGAVRRSIIHQILDEGTADTKAAKKLGELGRAFVVSAATSVIDGRMEQVMTPEILQRLISEGTLPREFADGLGLDARAIDVIERGGSEAGGGGAIGIPENPLRFLQDWRFSSPSKFKVVVGEPGKRSDWTGLSLKRDGSIWKLTEVKLSDAVMARVKPIIRAKLDEEVH